MTATSTTTQIKHSGISDIELRRIAEIANRPSRDRGYTRAFYSYPAKFLAHLPHELVKMLTSEGDVVYDAYCGGGTTGLECLLLGRKFVGYDINPFAILISKVKTRRLDPLKLQNCEGQVTQLASMKAKSVLDSDDRSLLGPRIATEVERIAGNIEWLREPDEYKDFFKLALIHSIKIVGRRDFGARISLVDQTSLTAFSPGGTSLPPGPSILPLFKEKIRKMKTQMLSLPATPTYLPRFVLGSNHRTDLGDESVDLIVTSPPYKDVDVEYSEIQIQRPESHKSKRSDVISAVLGVNPIDKVVLCGFKNDEYWSNFIPSLKECHRVSKPNSLAFFWVGLKEASDKRDFDSHLNMEGFRVVRDIRVQLSKDRTASSRSLHHGRDTGMLEHDFLFVTQRE